MSPRFLPAFLLLALLVRPALADSAKTLGQSGDWEGFAYSDKAGKVCYMAIQPKRSLNAPKGRGTVYVSITHRPAARSFDVFSVTAGYVYRKDAPAEADIDGAKFDLYTADDTAWTRNDKALLQALSKGKTLVVRGSPLKGGQTADTYFLAGFAKAYEEIGKACNKP